ncbi:MAG: D-alanyl transfer protein [Flavobacteriales bacterium]|nr:D-alanyl transfer protein [Flavobacteriales bacterium]
MDFNQTLPFTSSDFFIYFILALGLFVLARKLAKRIVPYRILLLIVSVSYIAILFPKPIHLGILILYLYGAFIALRKYYNYNNIILPMVILSAPMIVMKYTIAYPEKILNNKNISAASIVQIAGLSYLVFKVIGLYIDERKNPGKIGLIDFFNFCAFVPTLLIGPIDRYQRFKADTYKGYDNISSELFSQGISNFIKGLLYKFIIAESIHRLFIAHLIDDGSIYYHASYMYSYLFYLFFDFAGYSLLAIGFGNMIGIEVPINFNNPFIAVNPKDFWKRWHKSLGDWLGDYFFKPIFKNLVTRKLFNSIQRQNIALFSTFLLMGFWNGFERHYILSGILFACYSVIHNYYDYLSKKNKRDVIFGKINPKITKAISIFIMFNSIAFAIYIFSGKIL